MTDDKNCRDCKHLGADPDSAYCGHPKAFEISVVGMNTNWARGVGQYAEPPTDLDPADAKRAADTFGEKAICYKGKLFEPRSPEQQAQIDEMAERVLRRTKRFPEPAREPAMSLRDVMRGAQSKRFEAIPPIVCLCGSTRFHDEFQKANYELTMGGKIVLSVGFFVHGISDTELCTRLITEARNRNAMDGEWQSMGFWRSMLAIIRGAHSEDVGCTPIQKKALDDLHLRKIDISDEVRILNKDGYIGSSTQRELAYAIMLNRKLSFLEQEKGDEYLASTVRQHELGAHIAKFMEARL